MIAKADWDSDFFKKKIGVLTGDFASREAVAADLETGRAEGFEYLTCRPPAEDAAAIRTLEQAGFYLTDVGVIWAAASRDYLQRAAAVPQSIRAADERDLPLLTAQAVKLFRRSRFYSDPFFSAADADRLHVAWLENSVAGKAADAVFIDPDSGFVTCKLKDGYGEVPLIGVWEERRTRGAGRALMTAAVRWMESRGAAAVHVKTQVKNLRAMNFYHRLGFDLYAMDMTMCCMLRSAGVS